MRTAHRAPEMIILALLLLVAAPTVCGQSAGQNVNMVSGTGWTNGDPFLQRQNEPSLAVSTRNPAHLFAGANDYRSVDLPGILGIEEQGDAWLGIFKSFDGGQMWRSTLLPGYPLDSSPEGLASPLHGYQAAADPTVRAGTNGLFYYSGIAFNRGTNGLGIVFVSRFIDNDNKENGDPTNTAGGLTQLAPTDPIRYLGATVIDSGTSGQFLDKPWLATDIPRGNATCQVPYTKSDGTQGTQTIPAGNVYLTYSTFTGSTSTKIMFATSSDCGVTWGHSTKLSETNSINQGTIIVVDPSSGNNGAATIYVAWRRFATSSQPDALMIAKSTNGAQTFSKAIQAVAFPTTCSTTPTNAGCLFDQGSTTASFRTTAFPALAADDTGRVYLAWSQRQASGDARIMMQVSADGLTWSAPAGLVDNGPVFDDSGDAFSNLSGRGHQIMPSMTFAAGKLTLIYNDLREDHTIGIFTPKPDLSGYNETRQLQAELSSDPASDKVFNPYVSDAAPPLASRRHTLDVQGAQTAPLPSGSLTVPAFTTFRISRYFFGLNPFDTPNAGQAEQLQVNPPNLPMFVKGTTPFMGDYMDVAAAPSFVFQNGAWKFNISSAQLPVFHAVWTDNRDVRPPASGNWANYVPPYSASNPAGATNTSKFDPTQTVTPCTLSVNEGFVATRNQNIYTSVIAPGLVVGSLGNYKPLGYLPSDPTKLFQRAFTLTVRNTTNLQRFFRVMIANQPALASGLPDPAGQASLLQFTLQTALDVTIPGQSSVARPVFIMSANPTASVLVNVQEITASGGSLLSGGLQGSLTFNPDPSAPALLDPDSFGIANPTVNALEVYNPAIGNPAIGNPAIANPAILNPAIGNSAIANPAIANPAIANPDVLVALNPAIANPAIGNPAIANPAIANPAIANQPVTDASYSLTNTGNTSTSYALKLFQKASISTDVNLQLILVKQYLTPQAQGCDLKQQIQNVVVANIPNPVFTPASSLADPNLGDSSATNATIALAPGETGQVILRATVGSATEMQTKVLNNLVPVGVAHPANADQTHSATLAILSLTLSDGVVGKAYSAPVQIFGGMGAHTASVSGGGLPPGLQLDAVSGLIFGTPTTAGSYSFTMQVTDSSLSPATATQNFTIQIAAPLAFSTTSVPDGILNAAYPQTALVATGGLGNQTWSLLSGAPPTGLSLNSAGVISGTPTTADLTGSTFTVQVQDSASPPQTATATFTIRVATVLAITTPPGALPDAVQGVFYSFTFAGEGGVTPLNWTVASGQLPTGLSLSSAGVLSGTPSAPGSFTFTVQVQDSSSPKQTPAQSFSIRVAAPLIITTPAGLLSDALQGAAYSVTLQSSGGITPVAWSVVAGALPPGLTLRTNGIISGIPTTPNAAGYSFTARAQDASQPLQIKTVTLSIRVAAPLTVIPASGPLPDAMAKVAYSTVLTTSGGIGSVTWSLQSGSLPPGMSLSSTGVISGTSSATAIYSFTVQAMDSGSPRQTAGAAYTLTVASSFTVSFYVQPSNTSPLSQITPSIKVLVVDNFGNPVRGAVVQMTLAVNPGNAILGGQLQQTTGQNGIAVFANTTVSTTGKGYKLKATVISPQSGASATSAAFNVQ